MNGSVYGVLAKGGCCHNIANCSGRRADGTPVYLQDIWPTRSEIQAVEKKHVIPAMFKEVYGKIEKGSASWASLVAPDGELYPWDTASTYIKSPPYFDQLQKVN